MVLLATGLILLLVNSQTEDENVLKYTQHYEMAHWLGLLIWAFGYLLKEKKRKEKQGQQ